MLQGCSIQHLLARLDCSRDGCPHRVSVAQLDTWTGSKTCWTYPVRLRLVVLEGLQSFFYSVNISGINMLKGKQKELSRHSQNTKMTFCTPDPHLLHLLSLFTGRMLSGYEELLGEGTGWLWGSKVLWPRSHVRFTSVSFFWSLMSCQSSHNFISSSPLVCPKQLLTGRMIWICRNHIQYQYIVYFLTTIARDFAARFAEHLVASVFLHPEPYDVPSSFLTDQPRPKAGNSVPSAKHICVQCKAHMSASAERSCCCSRLIGTEQLCRILKFACVSQCLWGFLKNWPLLAITCRYLYLGVLPQKAEQWTDNCRTLPNLTGQNICLQCKRI